MNYCDSCEYTHRCQLPDGINFCEDCKYYPKCTICDVYCLAGHEIECNNGFENKNEYCCEDDEEDDT